MRESSVVTDNNQTLLFKEIEQCDGVEVPFNTRKRPRLEEKLATTPGEMANFPAAAAATLPPDSNPMTLISRVAPRLRIPTLKIKLNDIIRIRRLKRLRRKEKKKASRLNMNMVEAEKKTKSESVQRVYEKFGLKNVSIALTRCEPEKTVERSPALETKSSYQTVGNKSTVSSLDLPVKTSGSTEKEIREEIDEIEIDKIKMEAGKRKKPNYLVAHMSYKIYCNQIVYQCELCRVLSTTSKVEFRRHIIAEHNHNRWYGSCNSCSDKIKSSKCAGTLIEELNHMVECHIAKDSFCSGVQRQKSPMVSIPSNALPGLHFDSNSAAEWTDMILLDVPSTMRKLKPWIYRAKHVHQKYSEACNDMLSFECLSALFKCLGSGCSYYTSDAELFKKHLALHKEYQRSEGKNYSCCSYCDFNERDENRLIKHIIDVHGNEQYQCPYCFFRSFSIQIETHLGAHHKDQQRSFILCDVKNAEPIFNPVNAWDEYIKNLPALTCMRESTEIISLQLQHTKTFSFFLFAVCKDKFYGFDEYSDHLKSHEDIPTSKCLKCKKSIGPESLIGHLWACHRFGDTQCAFCRFGTNSMSIFKIHLSNMHPEKPPLYFDRRNQIIKNSKIVKVNS